MKTSTKIILAALVAVVSAGGYLLYRSRQFGVNAFRVQEFIYHPENHQDWMLKAGSRCQDAPFQMPVDGFIGFLWDDSFRLGHHHQGIDIFSGKQSGVAPIYAAYDGYLSRLPDWKSTVIIRIPDDPLEPGRQIWTYYTHMAMPDGTSLVDAAFPPGAHEVFVKAGTLLGKMGNYSGTPGNPTGVHLHFSIVVDDGKGGFKNELDINNTLDPSPYFGFNLNKKNQKEEIPGCVNE
jgi:murein DD-endopeptidase MepM/ murein hydrolase activator NlpD